MKRVVVIVLLLLVVAGGGNYVYQELQQKPAIRSGTLSERSKQFLKKREGAEALQYGNIEGKTVPDTQIVAVDDCFRFILPFKLKFSRKDGVCDMTYGLLNPGGNVIAYQRNEPSQDWNAVPGVSMRRMSGHTYAEKTVQAGGKEFLTFKNKEASRYERNAFYRTPEYFIVINLLANTGQDLDGKFEEMLGSLEVN